MNKCGSAALGLFDSNLLLLFDYAPHSEFLMEKIEYLQDQIKKTEKILAESQDNYKKNPDEYSAKLLLMSTENHLADLLRQLDIEEYQKNVPKP